MKPASSNPPNTLTGGYDALNQRCRELEEQRKQDVSLIAELGDQNFKMRELLREREEKK